MCFLHTHICKRNLTDLCILITDISICQMKDLQPMAANSGHIINVYSLPEIFRGQLSVSSKKTEICVCVYEAPIERGFTKPLYRGLHAHIFVFFLQIQGVLHYGGVCYGGFVKLLYTRGFANPIFRRGFAIGAPWNPYREGPLYTINT